MLGAGWAKGLWAAVFLLLGYVLYLPLRGWVHKSTEVWFAPNCCFMQGK